MFYEIVSQLLACLGPITLLLFEKRIALIVSRLWTAEQLTDMIGEDEISSKDEDLNCTIFDPNYHPEPFKFSHFVMASEFEIEEHYLNNSFNAANGSIGFSIVDVNEYLRPDEDLVYQQEAPKLSHYVKPNEFNNKNNLNSNLDASSGSTCLNKKTNLHFKSLQQDAEQWRIKSKMTGGCLKQDMSTASQKTLFTFEMLAVIKVDFL